MALSIGVIRGSEIRIGDSLLLVGSISQTVVLVTVDGGASIPITDRERKEILPDVFLSLGKIVGAGGGNTRLAFEAPKSIKIKRWEMVKVPMNVSHESKIGAIGLHPHEEADNKLRLEQSKLVVQE